MRWHYPAGWARGNEVTLDEFRALPRPVICSKRPLPCLNLVARLTHIADLLKGGAVTVAGTGHRLEPNITLSRY